MKKIVLLGQVNVGKSTFFNRLISEPKAIVSKIPGTTRDCNFGICHWQDQDFMIIDTGGIEDLKFKNTLGKEIKKHIVKAIEQADIIFFLIEIRPLSDSSSNSASSIDLPAQAGGPARHQPELEAMAGGPPISNFEREIARLIKKSKKPCFLILNKADNPLKRKWGQNQTWLKLGLGEVSTISAANGTGVGDLLDKIINFFGKTSKIKSKDPELKITPLKVAIIGKPNVGKSTLLNALLGEEKVIVSSLPHTTRGPQDTLIYFQKKPLLLIDTAGIRKKAKIKSSLEKIGVQKSFEIVKKADLVLMVTDVSENISHQDKALLDFIIKKDKSLIVVINKCDLKKSYQLWNPLAQWAPRILISAKTGVNVEKIFPLIQKVNANYNRRIAQEDLTNFLKEIIVERGFEEKIWKVVKIRQFGINPPKFFLKVSRNIIRRRTIKQAQINIIEKGLRKKWPFEGTPIKIKLGT